MAHIAHKQFPRNPGLESLAKDIQQRVCDLSVSSSFLEEFLLAHHATMRCTLHLPTCRSLAAASSDSHLAWFSQAHKLLLQLFMRSVFNTGNDNPQRVPKESHQRTQWKLSTSSPPPRQWPFIKINEICLLFYLLGMCHLLWGHVKWLFLGRAAFGPHCGWVGGSC